MVKRSRTELIHDILSAVDAKGIIKPTHLLYKANLSHTAMQKYLAELMESGFLEEKMEKGRKVYALTEKGKTFLREYDRFTKFKEAFGI